MRKILGFFARPFEKILNNMRFKHKFLVLYFSCVIIPLIVTDSIIIKSVYEQELNTVKYDMEYVAGVYQNFFENTLTNDETLANSFNMNERINKTVEADYEDPYDFYNTYFQLINDSFLETTAGLNRNEIVLYADNEDILDSQFVKKISNIYTQKWYSDFIASGRKDYLSAYYDYNEKVVNRSKRKFYYIKRLDYYKSDTAKVLVIGHDWNTLTSTLKKFDSKYPVYVIVDDYVVFASTDPGAINAQELDLSDKLNVIRNVEIAGNDVEIVIVNNTDLFYNIFKENLGILLFLLIITIIIPVVVLTTIERTIIKRIVILENAFGSELTNTFSSIRDVQGKDEIASLMNKYNKMVDITNELISTVYKDKIKEQESDIARQKAELLALQSQINPHFMFNALESIRMHSLLKGETETASMVDKLAVMERQNVDWGRDFVTIRKEIDSIGAYLALQSYRFGDRLSFSIEADDDCMDYLVPKLTVVTFVENACVHGIESKASQGWIFVRIYRNEKTLYIEIEDTGEGMEEEKVAALLEDIQNASIDTIKTKKHVGILNACLRIKMITDNKARFDIESEEGVGLTFLIKIPLDKLTKSEGEE